jgi:hypothetical protein
MDPNSQNPQGGSDAVKKLEQDLQNLTQQSAASAPPTPEENSIQQTQPVVEIPPIVPPPPTPITAPTPPVATNPPIHEIPKKGSPLMIIAVILALVAVLAVAIYVIGAKFLSPQTTRSPTPAAVVTPSPTPDPTANWKTYLAPDGSFSFKYPANYSLGYYAGPATPVLLNNRFDWQISKIPTSLCRGDCALVDSTESAKVGGYQMTKFSGWVGSIGGETPQSYLKYEIKNPLGDNYFIMTLWELDRRSEVQKDYSQERKPGPISNADNEIFYQIISTFKFIEATPTASPTASPSARPSPSPLVTPTI